MEKLLEFLYSLANWLDRIGVRHRDQEQVVKLTYEYGKPPIGMALGAQRLFSGDDSNWESPWEPSEPESSATLWRYMSLAKFCSLLERRALFFSLVGDMADRYEGFIYPLSQRDSEDRLEQAERLGRDILQKYVTDQLNKLLDEVGI